jgi:hypothetical protein
VTRGRAITLIGRDGSRKRIFRGESPISRKSHLFCKINRTIPSAKETV